MTKRLTTLLLTSFLVLAISPQDSIGDYKKTMLLADGFILAGLDGRVTAADSNGTSNKWSFELDAASGDIYAGLTMELLPSSALEKIIADSKNRSAADYRIWGRVTKCRDRNFIFPIYFLAVSEIDQPQSPQPQSPQQQQHPMLTVNEPNDILDIPDEIVARLSTRRIIRPHQPLQKGLELKQDCILADRTGFLTGRADDCGAFTFDGLGQNYPTLSLKLLPCQILEQAQRIQAGEPDPVRFRVSGILTRYNNENYLLLQQATRLYSLGNFGR